jgi:hypothetical protein
MPSPSAIINISLRKSVTPALKVAGFEKTDARNGWRWEQDCIWVFTIRGVGAYFSASTGFPASSVCVWLGVYYTFIPTRNAPTKVDKKGRLLPAEHDCHMRNFLNISSPHPKITSVKRDLERARTDIWWISPDGSDAERAALEIRNAFVKIALPWYQQMTDLRSALIAAEAQRDCFSKFVLAAHIAKKLKDSVRGERYTKLAEAEGARVNEKPDSANWYEALSGLPPLPN